MPTVRKSLEGLDPSRCDHPYLAFERLIKDAHVEVDGKRRHQDSALQRDLGENLRSAYSRAFDLRYKVLEDFDGGIEGAVTKFFSLKVEGRLAAGLGNASVLENGLSLNHTYGLPYLPGTGLKGMASAMAHLGLKPVGDAPPTWQRGKEVNGGWTEQGADHKVLFGTMDTGAEDAAAGIVIFHDSWWDPTPGGVAAKRLPFDPDVMTPHHQKYNLKGDEWPNDWESPIPVPFLTVSGTFRIALTGPVEWVDAAFEILSMAFKHLGFGAKTQIGYGRGKLDEHLTPTQVAARKADEERAQAVKAEEEENRRREAEISREQKRANTQKTVDGQLIRTDAGRGQYRLKFSGHTLEKQTMESLLPTDEQTWMAIAQDAQRRGDRGGRVKVTFCIENGNVLLLGLAANIPPA